MELTRIGKEPISKDHPAGGDVRYDPVFDQLQTEVEKSVSVFSRGSADWRKIADLSSDILSSKSKESRHRRIPLAVALIHTQQAKGFITGSNVMMDMIENYWNDGFPAKTRARGRSRAIDWWIEKTSEVLKTPEWATLSTEEADRLCERFEKVHQFLRGELDDCPSFGTLITSTRIAAERSQTLLPSSPATALLSSSPAATGGGPINPNFRRNTGMDGFPASDRI